MTSFVQDSLRHWQSFAALAAILLFSVIAYWLILKIFTHIVRRSPSVTADAMIRHWRSPARLILPVSAIYIALPVLTFPDHFLMIFKHIFSILMIFSMGWFIIRSIYLLEDVFLSRYQVNVSDNLRARKIHTQIQLLRKVAITVIIFVLAVAVLMTFEKVRYLGTSLLASAGIAGIIVGFAAQKSIATLLAGIQVAITQPVRIDDVVIMENEWGRIEEITLTYLVVKIWDERRLILPITYVLDKPFQNWTRVSAELLGTVFIYADYTVSVGAIRDHLCHVVENTAEWDGRVCVLQVTDMNEKAMELRALISAKDASSAWTLRCHVREKLIEFCKENKTMALPRFRAEVLTEEKTN